MFFSNNNNYPPLARTLQIATENQRITTIVHNAVTANVPRIRTASPTVKQFLTEIFQIPRLIHSLGRLDV